MPDRAINFGASEADTDFQMRQNGDDWILEHLPSGATFEYDDSESAWIPTAPIGTSARPVPSVTTDEATLNGSGRPGILQKQSATVTADNTEQSVYVYDDDFRPSGLALVYGETVDNEGFTDIVLVSQLASTSQVSSQTRGSPGARTYDYNGDLAISWDGNSNSYEVTVIAIGNM